MHTHRERKSPVAGNPGTPGREAGATPLHTSAEIGHREQCPHQRDSSDVRWGIRHHTGRRNGGHVESQICSQVTGSTGILVSAPGMSSGASAWNASGENEFGTCLDPDLAGVAFLSSFVWVASGTRPLRQSPRLTIAREGRRNRNPRLLIRETLLSNRFHRPL